jgi:RNA polymerase sigma-70 factor (ECF subfamily)
MGLAVRHIRLVTGERTPEGDGTYEGKTFDDCFRQFHRLVATIGFRMLGHRADVDDFVQDVFLEVHRSYHTLRDRGAAKAWIRSIAVRVAIKRLRRKRIKAVLGFDEPAEAGPFPVEANQEHAALVSEVYRALEAVPAKARVVWVLRYVEGEKLEDIAALSGMGLTTVKRHLATAMARLHEVFDA